MLTKPYAFSYARYRYLLLIGLAEQLPDYLTQSRASRDCRPSRCLESSSMAMTDNYSDHVTELIATCARTLYAIRTLRAHGLTGHALHTVFKATVQARLLYCTPAWLGFCNAADRTRLDSFLRRCKRLGYCDVDTSLILEQFQLADEALFERVQNDDRHVLYVCSCRQRLNTVITSDADDTTMN